MTNQINKVIIVGSGPAGYAAGIYLARAALRPLMLAGETSGGQLMFTTQVENYAGFSQGIMGPELMMEMRKQAEIFGTKIIDAFVTKVDLSQRPFKIWAKNDESQPCLTQSVILATGASSRMLGIKGGSEYLGRGVATCAVCDAAFYRGKRALVVGGGDAAMEDVLALTKFAQKVFVMVRGDELRASKIMKDRVLNHEKVEIIRQSEALEVMGDGKKVVGIKIRNNQDQAESIIEVEGMFLAIGHIPATEFLKNSGVALDGHGYVKTGLTYPDIFKDEDKIGDSSSWLANYPTMTNIPGVFAAGDNVDFRYRQAITAAGYGAMAALDAEKWLQHENLG